MPLRLAALVCLLSATLAACAPPGPPDVLLVVVDSLRADRLGCYGYQHSTHDIDELAEESLRFENAYAHSSRTLPSLASLLTSRLPSQHGLVRFGQGLPAEVPTLAEAFAQAGYDTVLVSASADVLDPATGLTRGFDVVRVERPLPQERSPATDPALVRDRPVTKHAIEQINAERQAPLFMVVHYLGPHAPYDPKPGDMRPGTRSYQGPADGSLEQLASLARGELDLGVVDLSHLSGRYDAKVAGIDDEVETLVGHLRRSGRLDDTLLAFTADHGEALRGDGAFFHGTTLHREQIRVPLLLHRPGGEGAGDSTPLPVGLVDLGPTLLALAGHADPREGDGRSFAAALDARDEGADAGSAFDAGPVVSELHDDPAWSQVWGPRRHRAAVSDARWSLLVDPQGEVALYDHVADPQQETDLAAQQRDVVERLSQALSDAGSAGS